MSVETVASFRIENEIYADDYLKAIFERPEHRSMDQVHMRAAKHISDPRVKKYFIDKAKAYFDRGGAKRV